MLRRERDIEKRVAERKEGVVREKEREGKGMREIILLLFPPLSSW